MQQVLLFLQQHKWAIEWLVVNAIILMPEPKPEERWYGWVYNVIHIIPLPARLAKPLLQQPTTGDKK